MPEIIKNIYDEIGRPSIKHHKAICKLIEPLNLYFGVDRFWRNYHSTDGSYSLIGNYPPTAEVFFGQNLYKGHPYFRNPIFFQSGYTLPELHHCQDYEITQGKLKNEGDCYHVLINIRKQKHGLVEYGFATSRLRPGFETTYLNHLSTFNKFIDFFEVNALKIIQEANEYRINISKLIGSKYNEKPTIAWNILVPEKELSFLAAVESDSERAKSLLSLTKSEKTCLSQYLSGNTAKEIAKNLHRSPRTIEMHLENAKGKLGINTRSALFDLLVPYRDFL